MAKGIKAAPKNRKTKRLSEHARLVEERARSIPPGVVHELFDTSELPVPPPAPARHPVPARMVSKPPPPPPRPSRPPGGAEEAELTDLEELEAVGDAEESRPDAFGTHTLPPVGGPVSSGAPGARASSPRSRALPVVLGVVLAGGLALVLGRELGRSRSTRSSVEPRAPATSGTSMPARTSSLPLPRGPVADDLPRLPPGVTDVPSAAPVDVSGEPTKAAGIAAASSAAVLSVSPDAASVAASNPVLARPAAPRGTAGGLPATSSATSTFDPALADVAIKAAFQRARGCRSATDPKGVATATLTYAPSGRVTTALVSGTFAGTPIGSCVAAALRSARVEPFTGALVTVKRSAALE